MSTKSFQRSQQSAARRFNAARGPRPMLRLSGSALLSVRGALIESQVPPRLRDRMEREVAKRLLAKKGLLTEPVQAVVMLWDVMRDRSVELCARGAAKKARPRLRIKIPTKFFLRSPHAAE